jgi:polyisoprenoid-binding protein YceI
MIGKNSLKDSQLTVSRVTGQVPPTTQLLEACGYELLGTASGVMWAGGASFRERSYSMRLALLFLAASILFAFPSRAQAPAGVPVFQITPPAGGFKITFNVKASVPIEGVFEKWDATLKFTSADVTTGVLDIKVDAASVNTGSGLKDGKLKGKDFFDAKDNPYITFHSFKIEQTGPTTFEIPGTFTIRGVSKPETLSLNLSGKGTGTGHVQGSMAFDRKEYGMNSGIPFIKIADRVEIDVALEAKQVSGPHLVYKE